MSAIEALLRKELRTGMLFDPKREVILTEKGSIEHTVAKELLKKIFNDQVNVVSVTKTTKRNGVFRPTTLERELVLELRQFLDDGTRKPSTPALMHSIPEADILAFARRNGLKGRRAKSDPFTRDVRRLLERLQQTQPQTKACLRKSFAYLAIVAEQRRKSI